MLQQAFLEMLLKISPLIIFAFIGWGAEKIFKIGTQTIASIMIYFLFPVVTFHGIFTAQLNPALLSLPFIFFILAIIITSIFYAIGKNVFSDNRANLLAFASSYCNYAYFAIPAGIAFFGKSAESLIITAGFGFTLYTTTFGYYITAKGNFTTKQAITKTLQLPSSYFFILGLIANSLGLYALLNQNNIIKDAYLITINDLKSTFSFLGMAILGIAIAQLKMVKFDAKFIGLTLFAQFIVWPAFILGVIFLDKNVIHFMNSSLMYNVLLLLSLTPVGTTLVAYSAQLDVQPQKASMAVVISSVLALLLIPLVFTLFQF